MSQRLASLANAGVSIWLDDLSRRRINDGSLADLIREDSVVGVTTNPTIFAAALSHGDDYLPLLSDLAGVGTPEAIKELCAGDVRAACDLFADVFRASAGVDGRVSIEVDPTLAHDAGATVAQARELRDLVDRDNVLIKIPATREGLAAIESTIAAGISVNATLIFSVERYVEVMEAYVRGLERALAEGRDLSGIHSVASFFISRLDTEVDARLAGVGHDELRGRAGIANAMVAHGEFEAFFASDRFRALRERGAHVQRPLWASTGTKDPSYPDTLYVSGLVARGVVNTMPEKVLRAFADHGEVGAGIEGRAQEGREVLGRISAAGVDLPEVFRLLEVQGVEKFRVSWSELIDSVEGARASLGSRA